MLNCKCQQNQPFECGTNLVDICQNANVFGHALKKLINIVN